MSMIARVWHGWTRIENADRYEELIRSKIFPGILNRRLEGFETIELYRRTLGDEVEFITVMRFASLDAVKAFAGPDWETSVVPEAARAVLSRFDDKAQHYEVRVEGSAIGKA
jgi:antibiotic biosynthesis monooxygenase (ABM) superfamily enzyme